MLRYPNKIHKASAMLLVAFVILVSSCTKANVDFGKQALTDDPNTIIVDTMTVLLSTFQIDSFPTSGDNLFKVGVHIDPEFGLYESKAYMQLGVPTSNGLNACNNCTFDSIAFVTKYTGAVYGDSTEDFTLSAHRITQQMIPDVTAIGYNVDSFSYDTATLGSILLQNSRPLQQKKVSVKMDDAFGVSLFNMLRRNSDTITNGDIFSKFFNGLVLTGKGAHNNSVYYFSTDTTSSEVVMKVYYTSRGTTTTQGSVNFPLSPTSYQFNGYTYDKTNTNLASFIPRRRQIIPTSRTGDNAYLHGNSGLYPYFSLPYLFTVKELHPYIKVIKAELDITPSDVNYGPTSPYFLPPLLELHTVSQDNVIGGGVPTTATGSTTVQNGSLIIDNQNRKNTKYTYDLTNFINTILKNGLTAQTSLALIPGTGVVESRLILENGAINKSVKLKLYVIGL